MIKQTTICVMLIYIFLSSALSVQAEESSSNKMFDNASLFIGQGIDHNFLEMPKYIATGNLDWESSYMTGIAVGNTIGLIGNAITPLENTFLGSISHGYELVFVQHSGKQHNTEIGAAYILRTPDAQLGPLRVNLSVGSGLSQALGDPTYEDGSKDDPDRRYRLQLLFLSELEWRWGEDSPFSLITRIHHRSGVYGLIAPQNVGSNFLAMGVRYHF
jgi:hypothetical protein